MVETLLTGGDPRGLRNAAIVVDAASRQPERLEELVQCVFSADEIVRMRVIERTTKPLRDDAGKIRRSALRAGRTARHAPAGPTG